MGDVRAPLRQDAVGEGDDLPGRRAGCARRRPGSKPDPPSCQPPARGRRRCPRHARRGARPRGGSGGLCRRPSGGARPRAPRARPGRPHRFARPGRPGARGLRSRRRRHRRVPGPSAYDVDLSHAQRRAPDPLARHGRGQGGRSSPPSSRGPVDPRGTGRLGERTRHRGFDRGGQIDREEMRA